MPRTRIPAKSKWSGQFPGETFGNLYLTKNVDLERNRGKVVLGEALSSVFDSADDADLTTPVAFVRTSADSTDRWWALGGKLFKTTNTNPETGWTQDAISNSPTAPLYDAEEFVDDLYVATSTNVDRLVSGTWTNNWWSGLSGASALQSGVPHRFAVFSGAILITDGRFINSYDGTIALDPDLTLPSQFEAQFILTTADYAVIACNSSDGSEAEVFFWDRTSATFNARYAIGDTAILAGFVAKGIPYMITKTGDIRKFTGTGFRSVNRFDTVDLGLTVGNINPNGVIVEENLVRINVDFGVLTNERLLSGVWTFDTETGNLYHSMSPRNDSGNDYSQQELNAVGAITATSRSQGRYLIGASVYTDYSGSTKQAIFTSDESATSGQRGYIWTPKIPASNVRAMWKQLFPIFNDFKNATDRIRVMYRTIESTTLPAYETITWVTSTTFTGTNDDVAVGDFVEILAGDNAGAIARITNIVDSAPNTFTIDKTLNASTNDARARYLNFNALGEITEQGIQEAVMRISERGTWVQFLIELDGKVTSPELETLLLEFDNLQL